MRLLRRGLAERVSLASLLGCVAIGATAVPKAAAGQPAPQQTGWPAVEIGARVGYDSVQREEVVGGLLRIPVLPSGRVEFMPSADVTFLRGLKEYQFNAEAVYIFGGGDGGLYAGGGIGFRNTIPPSDPLGGRKTLTTYAVVFGLKITGVGRVRPLIEFRRIFASDLAVDPSLFSLGATVALW